MSIKKKIFILYFLVGLEGIIFVEFQNLFVLGRSWEHVLKYNLPFVVGQNVIFLIIYYFYTVRNLKDLLKWNIEHLNSEERTKLFNVLVHFPYRIFKFSILFMLTISILFHVYEMFIVDTIDKQFFMSAFFSLLREQSIGMIITLTIMAFTSKILQPYIIELHCPTVEKISFSIKKKIYIVFFSLLFIVITDVVWITYKLHGSVEELILKIGVLLIFLTILSIITIKLTILDSLSHIQNVSRQLSMAKTKDRDTLHSIVPVTSNDEIGYLLGNFNNLQQEIRDLYKDIDEELKLAYYVQNKLLPPTTTTFNMCRIDARTKPVKDVGGDFFDIIKINSKKLGIVVGDVSGKGVPAGLLMSVMIGLVRGQLHKDILTPAELLTEFNKILSPILKDEMYVTVSIAVLDFSMKTLTYASAGHVPPIIKGKEKTSFLEQSSFPLGIDSEETYVNTKLNLEQIESILFYSDGIVEQWNHNKEKFGFDRLAAIYEQMNSVEIDQLLSEINQFTEGVLLQDDITVVNVRFM